MLSSMLELEDAVAQILAALPPPTSQAVPVAEAFQRVLSNTVLSPMDLPPFDNSAMDGYAVRSSDVKSARPDAPVSLQLAGRVAAGELAQTEAGQGRCIRVFTGSMLPHGADAVVMQEDTRPNAQDQVLVLDPVKPWENVRFRGEDIKQGETLVEAGCVLSAGQISLLAAAGVHVIHAGRQPIVGLLATGTELQAADQPLGPGQIYDSNRIGLSALVLQAGGVAKTFPFVKDQLSATKKALEQAFEQCDAVVTSGGASVGEMDFIKDAFEQSGGRLDFWKVAIKPGRPFVFGRLHNKMLFGLPGNPVSALVTFLLLVRPGLLAWQGASDVGLPSHSGILTEALDNPGPRRHFVRVRVDPQGNIRSSGTQASHRLSSLARANGLVDLPSGARFEAGTLVRVLRFG